MRIARYRYHERDVLVRYGLFEANRMRGEPDGEDFRNFNPTFATVGVDKAGNVGIVAESSTSATDLSVLLWTHRKTDAPNTFNGPTTIVSGTQPYTCLNTNNFALIGNAAGILTALDPADGTKLWTSQQWSNDAARCVWKTRIVQYQIAGGQ